VSRWTGVPVTSIKEEETQKLLRVEEELHRRIISQEKAISALARAIRRSRAGLKSPHRPIGSFLFLGPTGVGKTEMARTLANFLFGSDKALIRFDMSEFMEKHSVSKLIGSPPGYVGYEEGGQLTERVKRSPYSVVLLDEIEKAHPDVFNILLQVFEDGQLTDGLGNTVDFKNTIIIMTSNIGARHLQKKQGLGFQSDREDLVNDKVEELVKQEVKKTFNPEFLNRLDEVILFLSLSDADLIQIVELLVQQLNTNLAQKAITISVTEEAKKWILDKTLGDRSYGARHLQKREGLGFASTKENDIADKVEELVKNEVKRTFNPEFLNRIDEIIIFNALGENDLIQILELMVTQLNQNLAQKSITVTVADEAKKWILNQTLTDRTYGARPLRRALQKYIEDPLSEALIQGTINVRPAFIEVFLEGNKLFYRPVDSKENEGVLLYENS